MNCTSGLVLLFLLYRRQDFCYDRMTSESLQVCFLFKRFQEYVQPEFFEIIKKVNNSALLVFLAAKLLAEQSYLAVSLVFTIQRI